MTQPPTFEFDPVIDYEKIAESCNYFCLPDYFREALPEFLRQLTAGGFAVVKLPEMVVDDVEARWPLPAVDPWADVYIRRSDGRIGTNSVPSALTPEQALLHAAALIAAARHKQEKNDA